MVSKNNSESKDSSFHIHSRGRSECENYVMNNAQSDPLSLKLKELAANGIATTPRWAARDRLCRGDATMGRGKGIAFFAFCCVEIQSTSSFHIVAELAFSHIVPRLHGGERRRTKSIQIYYKANKKSALYGRIFYSFRPHSDSFSDNSAHFVFTAPPSYRPLPASSQQLQQ